MNLSHDMSLISLVTGATVPVQIVMALLLLASLVSWWYIFLKMFTIKRAADEADTFERAFWSGGDLNKFYVEMKALAGSAGAKRRAELCRNTS